MSKLVTTLLFIFLLSACSSQESNENNISVPKPTATASSSSTKEALSEKEKNATSEVKEENKREIAPLPTEKTTDKNVTIKKSLFTLTTIEGEKIHINESQDGLIFEEFKDKVVFLIFFGHKCPPCLKEIPVLTALQAKGHKDLEIIGIEVQNLPEERLKAFKERKGIKYNIVSGLNSYDFISYIAQKANWTGSIPFLLGFNPKGKVDIVQVGGIGASGFDNIYNSMRSKK